MTIKVYKIKVIKNTQVTKDVHILRIEKPENFEFNPGQYISISVQISGKKVRRPYSISSSPKPNYLEVCVKRLENGPASNYLCDTKKNQEIEFLGPIGKFTLKDKNVEEEDNILFISTGTGIGPFVSMVKHLLNKNHKGKINLITGFRSKEDLLYPNQFKNLKRKNVFSQKDNKYVQDLLGKNTKKFDKVYICGLKEMIKEVKEKLSKFNFPEENIFVEEWD